MGTGPRRQTEAVVYWTSYEKEIKLMTFGLWYQTAGEVKIY